MLNVLILNHRLFWHDTKRRANINKTITQELDDTRNSLSVLLIISSNNKNFNKYLICLKYS